MNSHRIKEIRKSKGLVLKEMAKSTGYTESYLSQIERGLKNPSLEALRRISKVLEVPVITFLLQEKDEFKKENGSYRVIRLSSREKIKLPTIDNSSELITPALGDRSSGQKFHGFMIRLEANEAVSEKMISHPADESVLVLKGTITVFLEDGIVQLESGDSIYIYGGMRHNYMNRENKEVEVLVYMSAEN